MAAFFTRKPKVLCGMLIDIGSGSVTASIAISKEGAALPEILYTCRKVLPLNGTLSSADRIRTTRHALFSVLLDIERAGVMALQKYDARLHIEKVVVSSTAPWAYTVAQMIRLEQETPFTVTKRMVDDMIAHAYEQERVQPEAPASGLKKGYRIVEKTIVDVTLNGYSVDDPYTKQASEIAVTHVRGLLADPIFHTIEEMQKRLLDGTDMHLHTAMLVSYCALRDLYPRTKNALIALISEEAIEIGLMRDSVFCESIVTDKGSSTLIRDMAAAGKTIPEESRGYLRAYAQNALKPAQTKAVAEVQRDYVHMLDMMHTELRKRYVLPQTVFLVAEPSLTGFFKDTFVEALRDNTGIGEKNIVPLSADAHTFVAAPPGTLMDPRHALLARFFHKLHACGEVA
ncbi:hypothetical protein HY416_01615 [Candidatus Kaiserbacteria bacterium]|nr:hypothetical protein [Candidatus Kaiserbacteria bacterium]